MEPKSSNEYRADFNEQKNKVLDLLSQAQQFYEKTGNTDYAEKVRTHYDNLKNGEFTIIVVGEFSAGKSTMLNALMHRRILPSQTSETTATVNYLRHKEKALNGEICDVIYVDGSHKSIDDSKFSSDDELRNTLMNYVTTKGENVAETVDHVNLYLDSPFLKDGVTLVDSPGLNGTGGLSHITEDQVEKSNACIFVFSSDHPGSKTDFESVNYLVNKMNKIFFVLNKIDVIKEDEDETIDDVIYQLKKNYKKQINDVKNIPEIYGVSGKGALDYRTGKSSINTDNGHLDVFEDRLMRFLTKGEKAQEMLLSPVTQLLSYLGETKTKFDGELEILQSKKDSGDLEEYITNLNTAIDELSKKSRKMKSDISMMVQSSEQEISEQLANEFQKFNDRNLASLNECTDLEDLKDSIEMYDNKIRSKISTLNRRAVKDMKQKIYAVTSEKYSDMASLINEQLNKKFDFKIEIKQRFESDSDSISADIRGKNKEIAELQKKINEIKKQEFEAKEEVAKKERLISKKEKLEAKVEDLDAAINQLELTFLPDVVEKKKDVEKWRGGLLGMFGNVLLGKKVVQEEVIDDTARKNAINIRDKKISKKNNEKFAYEAELSKYYDVEQDIADAKSKENRLAVDRVEKEKELTQLNELFSKEIGVVNERKIKKLKREIRDYVYDLANDFQDSLDEQLSKLHGSFVDIICDNVEENLREEIENKKDQLISLQHQLDDSEQEKNEKVAELNKNNNELVQLMNVAVDIEEDLSHQDIDKIKLESINDSEN